MKQPLLIVLALVLVGLVAFDSYEFFQKTQLDIQTTEANIKKTQQDIANKSAEIASLNKLKDGLKDQRLPIYESELRVRQIVLNISYKYDLSLIPPTTSNNKNDFWSGVLPFSNPNKIISDTSDSDVANCTDKCFMDEYINYLNLLNDYNSQAMEINFKAAQLGEPPVPLLEQYNPVFK